ncbi:hypothetical protein ABZ357_31205 [Streptomyces sp. NPDC005917]|uniref:hypothetical protein n=1 Tax=unclassified Streptomyces TaxID=2593676 RepID=UPI0033EB2A71
MPVPASGEARHDKQPAAGFLRVGGIEAGGAEREAFGAGVADLYAYEPSIGRGVQ